MSSRIKTASLFHIVLFTFFSVSAQLHCAHAQTFFRVMVQDTDRTALVHGIKKGASPGPLVIVLHGFSSSADNVRTNFGMDAIADREGFLVAYPDGFGRTWNYGLPLGKTETLPLAGGKPVDDIAFLKALIERLSKTGQVDRSRVYLVGSSYGGMMVFAAACALSTEFAAVAPMITGMSEQQRSGCRAERALPMLVIAGTKDTIQTYGGENEGLTPLLSVPETLEFWKKHNACTAEAEATLPHREETDATKTVHRRYNDCRAHGALEFYRVEGGGHRLPSIVQPIREDRSRDFETAEVVWAFLKQFKLPNAP